MNKELKHIHHVGHVVTNMEEALQVYRRLGFDCAPPAYPALTIRAGIPKPLGAGNTHASFLRNFIEIVTVVKEGESLPDDANIVPLQVPPEMHETILSSIQRTVHTVSESLSRFEGTHILCLYTTDAKVTATRFDQVGVGHSGVNIVKRPVETTNGVRIVPVHYIEVDGEAVPEGRLAIAENPSEEIMQSQVHMVHPNGAIELVETFLCVEDNELEIFAMRYQRYFGHEAKAEGNIRAFQLGDHARLTLIPASCLSDILPGESAPPLPGFAGYAVAVRDIHATRSYLQDNEIPVVEIEAGDILVPSHIGLGTAIIFRQG